MKKAAAIILLITSSLNFNCGEGIAPLPEDIEPAGFKGKITFIGEWPQDVKRTHLVVFKDALNSSADFTAFNLRYLSNEIPFGIDEYDYSSADSSLVPIEAGEYSYVAVVQSTTEEVSLNRVDWIVAGIYAEANNPDVPAKLVVPENKLLEGINIICDFDNPPPQPPGGPQ